jgi:hypothetical protein
MSKAQEGPKRGPLGRTMATGELPHFIRHSPRCWHKGRMWLVRRRDAQRFGKLPRGVPRATPQTKKKG